MSPTATMAVMAAAVAAAASQQLQQHQQHQQQEQLQQHHQHQQHQDHHEEQQQPEQQQQQQQQLAAFCSLLTPTYMDELLENGTNADELFVHYWWCSTESLVHWGFKTFLIPALIIAGSVGNGLALGTLGRRLVRRCSVCFYLALYAAVNTAVLYISCGLDWLSYVTETMHVANRADWTCRVWKFVFNVVNYSGGWIVVAMTTDRVVHSWYPQRAHQLCTVFMSKLVAVFLLVGLVVVSIHAMWTYGLTRHGCVIEVAEGTHAFTSIAWPMVSAILYSYLPILLILTLDVLVVMGLLQPASPHLRGDDCADSDQLQQSLSVTVLAVGLAYLLLNLPTIVINIFMYSQAEFSARIAMRTQLFLLQEAGHGMACLNNALSFIIYFALIPLLRQDFRSMVRARAGCAAGGAAGDGGGAGGTASGGGMPHEMRLVSVNGGVPGSGCDAESSEKTAVTEL